MKNRIRKSKSEFVLGKKLQIAKKFDVPVCLKTIKIHPLIANLIASIGDVSSVQDMYIEDLKISDTLVLKLIELLGRFETEDEMRDNLLQIIERISERVSLKEVCQKLFRVLIRNFDNRVAIDIFVGLVQNYRDEFVSFLSALEADDLSFTDFFQTFVVDDISILPDLIYLSTSSIFKPEVKETMHDWMEFLMSLFSSVEEPEKLDMLQFFEHLCQDSPSLCKTFLKSVSFDDVIEDAANDEHIVVRFLQFVLTIAKTIRLKLPVSKHLMRTFECVITNPDYPAAAAEAYAALLVAALRSTNGATIPYLRKHAVFDKLLALPNPSPEYQRTCALLFVTYQNHLPEPDFGNDCTREWLETIFASLSSITAEDIDAFNLFLRRYKDTLTLGPSFPIDTPFLATISGAVGSNQAGLALISAFKDDISV